MATLTKDRLDSLRQRMAKIQAHSPIPDSELTDAVVFAQRPTAAADANTQILAELLQDMRAKKAPQAAARGHIDLNAITNGTSAASVTAAENEISEHLRSNAKLSVFNELYHKTGLHQEVHDALAAGKTVTIFAPTDEAHLRLPDGKINHLRSAGMLQSGKTLGLLKSHVALDQKKYIDAARAKVTGNIGAPSMQPEAHVGYQQGVESNVAAAVSYNDQGKKVASARIKGTYITEGKHMIHEIDSVFAKTA
jgi:uncharacterized surface protein with fasciclin (FAS1) repeats